MMTPLPKYTALVVDPSGSIFFSWEPILGSQGFRAESFDGATALIEGLEDRKDVLLILDEAILSKNPGLISEAAQKISGYLHTLVVTEGDDEAAFKASFELGADECLCRYSDMFRVNAAIFTLAKMFKFATRVTQLRQEWDQAVEQHKRLNESLTFASQRFGELFNGLPVACFTIGPGGEIHDWNRSCEELFGIAGYMAYQQRVHDILPTGEGYWTEDHIESIFEGKAEAEFDWSLGTEDEDRKFFACRLLLNRGLDGEIHGCICANVDITERTQSRERLEKIAAELKQHETELEEANRRLAELASTDTLTGLLNRRTFDQYLKSQAAQSAEASALVMIDIDHFKAINDAHGHQAGDDVIRQVANILRTVCGEKETPFRYGGEEFAVILRDTKQADAMNRAEAFRQAVEIGSWQHRRITISLGVASKDRNKTTKAERLIAMADEALYVSKTNGRNRVSLGTTYKAAA